MVLFTQSGLIVYDLAKAPVKTDIKRFDHKVTYTDEDDGILFGCRLYEKQLTVEHFEHYTMGRETEKRYGCPRRSYLGVDCMTGNSKTVFIELIEF